MSSLGSNRGGWMGAAMCTAIVVLLGFGCHFNGTQYDELRGWEPQSHAITVAPGAA